MPNLGFKITFKVKSLYLFKLLVVSPRVESKSGVFIHKVTINKHKPELMNRKLILSKSI